MNKVAIEYETSSVKFVEKERLAEEKVIAKSPMKTINLGKGSAKYLSIAHGEIWKELKKRSPKYADELAKLMYVDGKPNRQVDTGRTLDEKR